MTKDRRNSPRKVDAAVGAIIAHDRAAAAANTVRRQYAVAGFCWRLTREATHKWTTPYDRDENAFRTDGRDACHWCAFRPQAWVWGPYGTRVRGHCEELIEAGRQWEIAEEVAARITVRHNWIMNLDRWRQREHDLMAQWLRLRTTREPVSGKDDDD